VLFKDKKIKMDTIVELVILLVRLKIAIEPATEPEPEPATEPEPEPATEPEPEPATKVKVKREPLYYIRYIKQEPTQEIRSNDKQSVSYGQIQYTLFGRFNISLFRRDRVNADGTWNVSRIQEYYLGAGEKRPVLTRQCPDAVRIQKNEEPPEFVNKVDFLNSTAKRVYIKISEKKLTRKMFPEIMQAV
jgi:hypothetical protein